MIVIGSDPENEDWPEVPLIPEGGWQEGRWQGLAHEIPPIEQFRWFRLKISFDSGISGASASSSQPSMGRTDSKPDLEDLDLSDDEDDNNIGRR